MSSHRIKQQSQCSTEMTFVISAVIHSSLEAWVKKNNRLDIFNSEFLMHKAILTLRQAVDQIRRCELAAKLIGFGAKR